MDFHARLRQLRQKERLTQGELAEILDLKPTAISNYESGRNEPSFEKLIALSRYFNVSCDYLLGIADIYFPVSGEVIDKDAVEIFHLYQELDGKYHEELSDYIKYLIYKKNRKEQ